MSVNYVEIESVSNGLENKVQQDLKFKTGKFIWQVKFNTPLDASTVNNINLYVTSLAGTPLKTNITYDSSSNSISIEPLEPYAKNESYILNITTKVASKGGKRLRSPIQLQFKL